MTGSSSISSPISASSSTSDDPPGREARPGPRATAALRGWIRLTHPFPSVLDGLVSGGVAALAGAGPGLAVRIGLAMTLLQLAIGTVNDIVDAPRDAGHKPGKPIPAGLLPSGAASLLAIGLLLAGLVLAASVSLPLAGLGLAVLGIGFAYDFVLKGTAWSWLPFAVGIPLLPVFGWIGATGTLPVASAILVPTGVVAGAALAIGNALVDIERDRAAGGSSIAAALGSHRAGIAAEVLFMIVWTAAVASAVVAGTAPVALVALSLAAGLPVVAADVARRRGASSDRRERAWQVEAVGLALAAVAWLAAGVGDRLTGI